MKEVMVLKNKNAVLLEELEKIRRCTKEEE
jgi:hypothetical protein